jgi:hypothetical protein
MTINTGNLVFAIILIALGVGQITQFINFGNFHPGLILICVGFSYILR